jgi:APA family basic amino acid/polyamine antiporter
VKAAREIGAAAIVMQLRYRAGVPIYSKTLQTVLAKRPCRVIVAANPEVARAGIVQALPA